MKQDQTNRAQAKWLRHLFCANLVGLALSILALIPQISWIGKGSMAVSLASAVCLFMLTPLQPRYQSAAIFMALAQVLQILALALSFGTLPAAVLMLVAMYQEYRGHSELAADRDGRLSRRWNRLFVWQLAVGLLSTVAVMIISLILTQADVKETAIVFVINGAINAVVFALKGLYLGCLNKTARLCGV